MGFASAHHDHSTEGSFEKNDWFFFIFALPAILLMYLGADQGFNHLFFIGLGITFYGMAYFFVHDIFIHQRIHLLRETHNPYLLSIGERTNNITNTPPKREKENVLDFYGCPSNISKCTLNKLDAASLYLPTYKLFYSYRFLYSIL